MKRKAIVDLVAVAEEHERYMRTTFRRMAEAALFLKKTFEAWDQRRMLRAYRDWGKGG